MNDNKNIRQWVEIRGSQEQIEEALKMLTNQKENTRNSVQ